MEKTEGGRNSPRNQGSGSRSGRFSSTYRPEPEHENCEDQSSEGGDPSVQGPIDVFKSSLGSWDQGQLEVLDILDKYRFKSAFSFNLGSGCGLAIRFNSRNRQSVLTYRDRSVIYVDGEPKDSLMKPVTKILVGVAIITILITLVLKETPMWVEKFNIFGGTFPPWVLACVVIVFTRMRERTRDLLKRFGW